MTPKEELATKGFMRLWTELQEKDKRSATLEDEEMEHKEPPLISRPNGKESALQEWKAISENEEANNAKKSQQKQNTENHLDILPNNSIPEAQSEPYSLITKDYILSMMQDIPKRVEKPLFKKCLAHAGIAYYIQFNKETEGKGRKNGEMFENGTENVEEKDLLEMLKNMNKNT